MVHEGLGDLDLHPVSLEEPISLVQFKVGRSLIDFRLYLGTRLALLSGLVRETFLLFQDGRRAINEHNARLKQAPLLDLLRTKAVDVGVVGAGASDKAVVLHVKEFFRHGLEHRLPLDILLLEIGVPIVEEHVYLVIDFRRV